MPSIVKEIQTVEEDIKKYETRLDELERSLRLSDLTDEQRDRLATEQEEMQTKLKDQEKTLKGLRWENMKTLLVSVTFLFIGYIIYNSFIAS